MKCCARPRIVLVPYPAQGHVTPMLQLATAFNDHGLEPVIVVPDFVYDGIVSSVEACSGITLASMPSGLKPDEPRDFFTISYAMEHNMPLHLDRLLHSFFSDGRPVCMVVDLLASWAIQVSDRLRIPVGGFWPAMLATYHLVSAIPDLIQVGLISETGIPRKRAQKLPGRPMLSTQDLPWLVGSPAARKSRFTFWLQTLHRTRALKWLLVNSFSSVSEAHDEARPALQYCSQPQILPLRPLTRDTETNMAMWEEDRSCLDWLDEQPISSVVYVSFGSWVAPLGDEKIKEMALGLEATGRPFLWSLRPTWRHGLPEGYLDRVAGQGKMVAWAPQKEVLKHEAVGCYLCHCGWNSTVEAIEAEKRLLCYPVAGDQFLNCRYIVGLWGIGEQVKGGTRNDVEEGIRRVMEEGKEMQKRVEDLKRRVMGEEARRKAQSNLVAFLDGLGIQNASIE